MGWRMSGPRDLELATALYKDLDNSVASVKELGEDTLGYFVYLQGAILTGGWFQILEIERHRTFLNIVKAFPCYSLLAPYFDPQRWTDEEITALKVKHRLKR